MTAKSNELRIESIAAGGAGVGRLPDGRVVFVQRTAAGDRALVELTQVKKRFAHGRLLRVLEPGPGRRQAPCPHYARCGGCTLEHLDYEYQLKAKHAIVEAALQRIAKTGVPSFEVVPSPREFHYRNRVSFTLVRTQAGHVVAGFHEIDRPDRIVDITGACLLPEEPIARAWQQIRQNWGQDAALLPSGQELRLTLRASASGQVALLVDGGYGRGQANRLLEAAPALSAIWHRAASDQTHVLLAGEATLMESWQEERVELSGTMFLQVNRAAAELLEEHVMRLAEQSDGRRVIDAYCGIGLHARRLARLGFDVLGIELDEAAVEEAKRAAPPGSSFIADRVETALASALPADLVILNPPRAGIAAEAADALVASPPSRILYISCDPATLARDIGRLSASFALKSLRCFDLFPQTSHVESVAELECVTT